MVDLSGETHALTLGKYAPLHLGHEALINYCLDTFDNTTVLIYETDLNVPDIYIRSKWIKNLFPKINIVLGIGAPQNVGYDEETKRIQEEYVFKTLGLTCTHFVSSEIYGEHMSKACGATNVVFDIDRNKINISATKIRNNLKENKHYLNPIVYKEYREWLRKY